MKPSIRGAEGLSQVSGGCCTKIEDGPSPDIGSSQGSGGQRGSAKYQGAAALRLRMVLVQTWGQAKYQGGRGARPSIRGLLH